MARTEQRAIPLWAYVAGAVINLTIGLGLGYLWIGSVGGTLKTIVVTVVGAVLAAVVGTAMGVAAYDSSCSFDCSGWEGYGEFTAGLAGAMIAVAVLVAIVNLFTSVHVLTLSRRDRSSIGV